jgi:hypothetical protein
LILIQKGVAGTAHAWSPKVKYAPDTVTPPSTNRCDSKKGIPSQSFDYIVDKNKSSTSRPDGKDGSSHHDRPNVFFSSDDMQCVFGDPDSNASTKQRNVAICICPSEAKSAKELAKEKNNSEALRAQQIASSTRSPMLEQRMAPVLK